MPQRRSRNGSPSSELHPFPYHPTVDASPVERTMDPTTRPYDRWRAAISMQPAAGGKTNALSNGSVPKRHPPLVGTANLVQKHLVTWIIFDALEQGIDPDP
jgi:hypothetical protein